MAKALCRWLKLGERLQHNPVICLLCLRPLRDELQLLQPCQHVFCVPCFEDYTTKQAPLTDPTARVTSVVYCPTCLTTTTTTMSMSSSQTKTSNKLPKQLKSLVSAVEKQRCARHKQEIVATCATCLEACCTSCTSDNNGHGGHDILGLPLGSRNGATKDPAVAWRLDELVESVSRRRTLAVQAERLQHEQERARERTKEQIHAHARNQISAIRQQEAEDLRKVEQHYETVKTQVLKLQMLSRDTADATIQHIRYMHELLHQQPKRCKELLVNQPVLFARTRSLLLDSPPVSAPASTQLTETVCIQCITQIPHFEPGNDRNSTRVTVKKRPGHLPAVSHIEHTLQSILQDPDDNNKRTDNDDDDDDETRSLVNYRIRDKPQPLINLYEQCQNVEPASAIFLPDDRLVVAERKKHKISIWKPNCKKLDRDIVSANDIYPFAVSYWPRDNKLVYTDLRHFTVGFVGLEDEEPESLPYEILLEPHGIGVLRSNHLVASDQSKHQRGVKILDPYRTSDNIVQRYHQKGTPGWLTVLRDGRVAVTDHPAGAVYLYDGSGNLITSMPVPAPEQVIEDYNGDLLVASAASSTVMLYDGRQLKHRRNVLSMEHGAHSPASLALTARNGKLAAVLRTGMVRLYQLYDCD